MIGAKEILLLLLVVVLLFGRNKISELMGDVAKGIRSFKKGMTEDEDGAGAEVSEPKTIDQSKSAQSQPDSERTSSRS